MSDSPQEHALRSLGRGQKIMVVVAALAIILFLMNTSLFVDTEPDSAFLVAHRGLGQQYEREGLTTETCTAAQTILSGHPFMENTLASMQAAFDHGAGVVEFDIHRTADGQLAVFHDWTLDCRTEASGVTREFTLDSLQTLDVGYGYTADGGESYPLRGRGVGLLPSARQVFEHFPDRKFIVDIKSQDPGEAELLGGLLESMGPEQRGNVMVVGGGQAVAIVRDRFPDVRTMWRARLKNCLVRYLAYGWLGIVPDDCRNGLVLVPANYAPLLWGWPYRFVQRMEEAGSVVIIIGDYSGEGFSSGFDDPTRLREIPRGFRGGIWTDRIDLLGPALTQ